jgi:hypothetical protein
VQRAACAENLPPAPEAALLQDVLVLAISGLTFISFVSALLLVD